MNALPPRPAAAGADPHPDPSTDLQEVEAVVRRAGTSFHRGMRILPPDRRHAMYAIYAFCRLVDDIADDPGPAAPRIQALAAWRARIRALYAPGAGGDDPVTRQLAVAVGRFALREQDFLAVIDGMEMDSEAIVAPDLRTLDLYCDRVAAAVGRLSVRAFGDASAEADAVAYALGRALQLTNILRDVVEDAGRGRLYLPREYLDEAGVPPSPALAPLHPDVPQVCARLAADARLRFAEAHAAMRRCDRRAMRPARLMGATYRAILARLERRGWRRLDLPAPLRSSEKLWIAVRYGLS